MHTLSFKFFNTQIFSISTEELVLPRQACCALSRLRCNGNSLLLSSYLSRIGRIENHSCIHPSQDTSHLILHCLATDFLRRSRVGDSLSLYDLWPGFWGSMVFRHTLILRKGSGINNNNDNGNPDPLRQFT